MDIAEVNRLMKQFEQSRKMMKQMSGMMGKAGERGKIQASFLIQLESCKINQEVKRKMAVKMRLKRMGKKKAPFYRVDRSRFPLSERWQIHRGAWLLMIRLRIPSVIKIDEELAKKWLANGAQPTETVSKASEDRRYRKIIRTGGDGDERISGSNC